MIERLTLPRLIAFLLLFAGYPAVASDRAVPAPVEAMPQLQMLTPDEQVQMGLQNLIAFMNQQPKPERKDIAEYLDANISPFFDWDYMARLASGRMYARFNEYQRSTMADDMKRRFLTQMVTRLTQWGGYNVGFLPAWVSPQGDRAVVTVQIYEPRRRVPAQIDLHLHFNPYGWAITDIVANGVSAVSWYRDQLLLEARYQNYHRRR